MRWGQQECTGMYSSMVTCSRMCFNGNVIVTIKHRRGRKQGVFNMHFKHFLGVLHRECFYIDFCLLIDFYDKRKPLATWCPVEQNMGGLLQGSANSQSQSFSCILLRFLFLPSSELQIFVLLLLSLGQWNFWFWIDAITTPKTQGQVERFMVVTSGFRRGSHNSKVNNHMSWALWKQWVEQKWWGAA